MWAAPLITGNTFDLPNQKGGLPGENDLNKRGQMMPILMSIICHDVIIWQLDDSKLIMWFSPLTFRAKTWGDGKPRDDVWIMLNFLLNFVDWWNLVWFTRLITIFNKFKTHSPFLVDDKPRNFAGLFWRGIRSVKPVKKWATSWKHQRKACGNAAIVGCFQK